MLRTERLMMFAALCGVTLPMLLAHCAQASAAENRLPEKIASMYTGWVAPNQDDRDLQADLVERMLDPLAAQGFNAFYAKFQGVGDRQFDLSDPEQFARVKLVADACEARGLALVAYTYHHPHHGRQPERFPEHAQYDPLVLSSGATVEDRFAMGNYDAWRYMTDEVFQLARASLTLPIAAVGIDIEHFMGFQASYDAEAWADFAAERGFDAGLPSEQRGPLMAAQGLGDAYMQWYQARWEEVVRRWCEEIHGINPDLSIAIMPARHTHHITRPFCVHGGAERAPAVIDNWGMYNGSGLTEDLLREQEEVKALNPHNRFILWFRPDSYRPEDIRVQAYHTLLRTDGYCNWHIGMLLPGADAAEADREAAGARWSAFGEANRTAFADLAAGREEPTIPFVSVVPMVAEMDVAALAARPIPQLTPVGDGSGDDRWIPTRDLQQFLIHAEAGGRVTVGLRHLAGQARPLALQYALITPDGSVLRNEAVSPGEESEFSVDAPLTGTYALWITGGAGGQAWYAVNVQGSHVAFPTFGGDEIGGRLFFVKTWAPYELWLARSDAQAPATLTVGTSRNQAFMAQVGNGEPRLIREGDGVFDLPPGDDPIHVVISEPQPQPDGTYIQYIRLKVEGAVHPYLYVSPERRLQSE